MSDQLKSIAFTAIVALICSLLLTGAATGLKDRKLRNVAVDRQKNILKSVGLINDAKSITVDQIERLYAETIRCMGVDGTGEIVPDSSGGGVTGLFLHQGPATVRIHFAGGFSWLVGKNPRIHGHPKRWGDGRRVSRYTATMKHRAWAGKLKNPGFNKILLAKKSSMRTVILLLLPLPRGRWPKPFPQIGKPILSTASRVPRSLANTSAEG
jgi:Na+-transporting NADH:ubiquinone oxidoreductase subunit C